MPTINYPTLGVVVLIFLIAAVVARVARLIITRSLSRLDVVDAENKEAVRARGAQLTRAVTFLAYAIAVLASAALAIARFGLGETRWDLSLLSRWVATHGVNTIIIVVGAFVVVRAANLGIDHLQFKLVKHREKVDLEWQRRAATLGGILTRIVTVAIGFVATLMLLRELSIDVVPILTGAGIAGLAVGFGAQNLVRDVISGFFLILEDQVRVGDLARINNVAGIVEQVNLRTIVLRDSEGAVQVFPNGTITALANLSKEFAYAVVDLHIAYNENLDRVGGTAREVGASMERDAAWKPHLLGSLELVGIESLDGGNVTYRVRFRTAPLDQGKVANELRRRLLGAMVGRGIRPYATQ